MKNKKIAVRKFKIYEAEIISPEQLRKLKQWMGVRLPRNVKCYSLEQIYSALDDAVKITAALKTLSKEDKIEDNLKDHKEFKDFFIDELYFDKTMNLFRSVGIINNKNKIVDYTTFIQVIKTLCEGKRFKSEIKIGNPEIKFIASRLFRTEIGPDLIKRTGPLPKGYMLNAIK